MPLKHEEQAPAALSSNPLTFRREDVAEALSRLENNISEYSPKQERFAWHAQFIALYELLEAQIKGMNENKNIAQAKEWAAIARDEREALVAGHAELAEEHKRAEAKNVNPNRGDFEVAINVQKGRLRRFKLDVVDKVSKDKRLAHEYDSQIREMLKDISGKARKARYKYVKELQEAMKAKT